MARAPPNRPVGVVLVRDRRPEQRQQPVAEELGHCSLVAMHPFEHHVEAAGHDRVSVLGIEPLGDAREADDVGE